MIKKSFIIVTAFIIIGLVIIAVKNTFNTNEVANPDSSGSFFEYPITPDDPEWSQLGSVESKIAACRIPEDTLKTMTNQQLIQAALDFPFIIDLFLAPSLKAGVESLEEISDAYHELLERKGAKESLLEAVAERASLTADGLTSDDEMRNDALAIIILYQDKLRESLTEKEAADVEAISEIARNSSHR